MGANVTVLQGVTIGDNSVIGAGCVVTKSIGENMVARPPELTTVELKI
ncbi:DapH/DapD/GlmU-related protein [Vibrio alfacsensis]